MYPSAFDYHSAATVQEALSLLAQFGDDAKLLAGGHSPAPGDEAPLRRAGAPDRHRAHRRPVGDHRRRERPYTSARPRVTPTCVASPIVRRKSRFSPRWPATSVIRSGPQHGDDRRLARPRRSRRRSASRDARVRRAVVLTTSGGTRTLAADDFFTDCFSTALQPGRCSPRSASRSRGAGSGGAYEKNPDPASGYAIVGIAVQLQVTGGTIASARVGMTGLGPMVARLTGVEAALTGQPATAATAATAASHAADGQSFDDDARGSAAYKANLATIHAGRAITRALAASGN